MKIKENIIIYNFKKILGIFFPIIILFFLFQTFQNYKFKNMGIEQKKDLSLLMNQTKSEKKIGEKVQIQVLNGCGEKGVAQLYTNFLRYSGYDVIEYGNAKNFDFKNTKIKIHNKEHEFFETEIINLLKIKPSDIEYNYAKNIFFDMTIIIGQDFKNLSSYKNVIMHYEPF
tara:strand:+ start:199 stop:711 length:513 start_codon:yes stop_codon:yes gene_type:complete